MEETTVNRIKQIGSKTVEKRGLPKDSKPTIWINPKRPIDIPEGQRYLLDLFKEKVISQEKFDPWVSGGSKADKFRVTMASTQI